MLKRRVHGPSIQISRRWYTLPAEPPAELEFRYALMLRAVISGDTDTLPDDLPIAALTLAVGVRGALAAAVRGRRGVLDALYLVARAYGWQYSPEEVATWG